MGDRHDFVRKLFVAKDFGTGWRVHSLECFQTHHQRIIELDVKDHAFK